MTASFPPQAPAVQGWSVIKDLSHAIFIKNRHTSPSSPLHFGKLSSSSWEQAFRIVFHFTETCQLVTLVSTSMFGLEARTHFCNWILLMRNNLQCFQLEILIFITLKSSNNYLKQLKLNHSMRSVDFCIELQWWRFLNRSCITIIGTPKS